MSTQDKPPGMPEEKPVDRAADKMRRKIQEATDELRALAAKDAEIAKLREQRDRLLAVLPSFRLGHISCDDSWYSCPKSEGGCANDSAGDDCTCGADAMNARIDVILREIGNG